VLSDPDAQRAVLDFMRADAGGSGELLAEGTRALPHASPGRLPPFALFTPQGSCAAAALPRAASQLHAACADVRCLARAPRLTAPALARAVPRSCPQISHAHFVSTTTSI
jgi:hypothetical protein